MKFIADLHFHSKYSRATSLIMNLENVSIFARKKGINLTTTTDFTHPFWFKELKEKLISKEPGFYVLKEQQNDKQATRFILGTEISSIYSKHNKVRRVHNLIFLPSLKSAEKINNYLSKKYNLKSDGRPILGLDSQELLKIVLGFDSQALFIPAHCWTPWFAVFGSMSGFNNLEEAFGNDAKYIYAVETGLSSSPAMNRRISFLDKVALISNSDAHSLDNLGREANVFDTEFSYDGLREAIINNNPQNFLYTVEFFPEEGKYYHDGHRLCQINFSPEQTRKHKEICPVCKKSLTLGVLSRIEELADRLPGFQSVNSIPFKSLIPLKQIIAESLGVNVKTKKTEKYYNDLILLFDNEFKVLMDIEEVHLRKNTLPIIAEGIMRMRQGKVIIEPGFDGEYGKIKIFSEKEISFL